MLTTRMFSLMPGIPGRRLHTPRMMRSICTPAADASYSATMISSSTSELSLTMIRPLPPSLAMSRSLAINSTKRSRNSNGATISFLPPLNSLRPVRLLKTTATSAVNSGAVVSRLRSV